MKSFLLALVCATMFIPHVYAYPKNGPWAGKAWGSYSAVYPRQTIKAEKTVYTDTFFGTQAECMASLLLEVQARAKRSNPTATKINVNAFAGLCWPDDTGHSKPSAPAGWPKHVAW